MPLSAIRYRRRRDGVAASPHKAHRSGAAWGGGVSEGLAHQSVFLAMPSRRLRFLAAVLLGLLIVAAAIVIPFTAISLSGRSAWPVSAGLALAGLAVAGLAGLHLVATSLGAKVFAQIVAMVAFDGLAVFVSFAPVLAVYASVIPDVQSLAFGRAVPICALMLFALIVGFASLGHYRFVSRPERDPLNVCVAGVLGMTASLMAGLISGDFGLALPYLIGWALVVPAILAFRVLADHFLLPREFGRIPVGVIGDPHLNAAIVACFRSDPNSGYRVAGTGSLAALLDTNAPAPGRALAEQIGARFLIIALPLGELEIGRRIRTILERESIPFAVATETTSLPISARDTHYFLGHNIQLHHYTDRLADPLRQSAKQIFDVIASVCCFCFSFPYFSLWQRSCASTVDQPFSYTPASARMVASSAASNSVRWASMQKPACGTCLPRTYLPQPNGGRRTSSPSIHASPESVIFCVGGALMRCRSC